jgi:hypothetical protein
MADITLSSLASLNSETFILKQLFTLWENSFSCKDGYSALFKGLLSGTIKALGIFFIQHLVRNPDKILTFFRNLILRFIYRRLELKAVAGSNDVHLNRVIQKQINPKNEATSSLTLSGVPMYLTVTGSYSVLEYCPIIHQKFLNDIYQEALMESAPVVQKNIKTLCRDASRKIFTPDMLFPSKNYKRLDDIVKEMDFERVQNPFSPEG